MANQLVPSSFNTTSSWTYDVFLSFRGEDTRTNFTDHVFQALVRNGINTFIDHCELPSGEEISPSLLKAIRESRISVIIFSENYASSRWCLDELVHILECRKSKGQMTRPIFYKVDPSDVRHQRNSYGAAFADHSRKYDQEKVQRWRIALIEAANLKGATLNKGEYETTFINSVVKEISTQVLNRTYLHVAKYPVGIESCVEEVEELLGVGGNDRRVVGIWGTSGIGKTTVAKAVHNAIAHKFEGSCFLADVRERSTSREGVIELQKRLLSKILCGTKFQIDNYHEGISLIKNRLSQKKILLILDDVDHLKQLDNLVQEINWFGEGSKVIITTKDRGLLDSYRVKLVYKVQTLEEGKALELLLLNAFGSNEPPKDYLRLARRALAYAQGLPLALNIIGSHLYDKHIDRWQAILDGYDSYDGEHYTDIQIILRKTYDAWDYGLQQVFLDIACFFKSGDIDKVLQILRSSKLGARQDCIEELVEKAIITIEKNRILMHDLLEQMGKRIVWEESPTEPCERSRLWFHEDVYNVLTENQGTKKIRSIVVELPESDVIPLNPESFLGMVNLETFINYNAQFSGHVDYLPNSLRWFDLSGRSIIDIKHTVVLNLPSNFHPRHLVKFDVSYSGIRQLKEFKNLAKLTWINLSGCEFLKKFPDLSGSPNIKHLNLSRCKNLVEVDDSVGFLDKLVKLDLSWCSNLTRFATRLGLRSLEELNLWGCTRLERFPEIEKDKMKSLTRLEIAKSGIKELPSSIAYLTGLRELYAGGCELQNVPDLSGSPNIIQLNLRDCTRLVEVDDSVGFLDKLQVLELSGCSKLTRFATRLGSRSLRQLSLKGCRRLESFPEIKGKMESLWYLDIQKSGIRELPSIAYFTRLRRLEASGCENIQLLSFGKKVKFDEVSSCSTNLQLSLELQGCNLSESDFLVPLDCWSALTELNLSRNNFVSLPDCISKAVNLKRLNLRDCKRLREIPKLPPRLERLNLCHCSGIRGDEVAKLENTLLNEEIDLRSQLNIIYQGNEVPKWFSYTSDHPKTIQPLPEYELDKYNRKKFVGGSEFRFEIPLKLQVGETLLGLALSFVLKPSTEIYADDKCIFINGKKTCVPYAWYTTDIKATHVRFALVNLEEQEQQGDICQVVFRFRNGCPIKSCGVHCLLRNQDELLHLSLRPTSSLGKRPRPRGSSDIVDDEYDQRQQRLSSSLDSSMANQLVSSSSLPHPWKYDVFLSFRGEDTCFTFTNHLYKALKRNGINTFIDRHLTRGEEISSAFLKAIEESRSSIIVFSENYASSRWCLDELVHILECRKSRQQIVCPVFYKVDPSHARNQKSSFGDAFTKLKCKFEDNKEKILAWESALSIAANLSGHTVKEGEYEATFINKIVKEISVEVLQRTCLDVARYPVGTESCAEEVEELLGVGGNDRRVVGIWGTSGIGKTTIAKAVYNAIAYKFEGSCFLENVSETLTLCEGVIQLQTTLLSDTLCGAELIIVSAYHGISLTKNLLSQKKILLILDDVDKLERLKDWVDVNCFGEGSRVIITTKDRRLLESYGVQLIYEVQKLEDDKALELFSLNAFKTNRPPDDYLSLARRAIVYAQGLPLALNIIGSHLCDKSIGRWQAILNSYDSYSEEPYTDIQITLRKNYDAWDCDLQQVFLDIACFFKGENKDYVLQMLRSSTLNVRQDIIDVLVEKAIIAIEDNRILMPNWLEKMGKHIVYEESPTEPGKRSRLWHHEDVCNVLIDCRGTKKIRGIVVNLPEPNVIPLNAKSFSKMVNLEFFINRNAHFSGCVDYLPNSLRLIEFGGQFNIHQKHTYVLNLPSNFHPRDLVSFDVPYSGIRQLKGFKNLAKLTWMNLSGCEFLEKIPDLSGNPNLIELDLSGCTSLVEVDDSIGFLDKLEFLDLSGCSNLTRFATRLGSRSLRHLSLNGCRKLESFPEIEGKMESLRSLDIGKSGIRELPSIAYFTSLKELKASGCELQNIQLLPFGKKVKFDEVSSCTTNLQLSLEGCNLSESDFLVPLECWSALTQLNLSRNNFVSLPDCISKAVNLEKLYLKDCKRLREIPVLPPKLEQLHLDDCTSLEKIPKLPPRLVELSLCHCSGLSGDEVAKLENNLLNEEIYSRSELSIIYPGNEVPKWFSYTSNHPITIQPLPEYEWDENDRKEGLFVGGSEFRFEIPLKLQVGETLLRLALSFVLEPSTHHHSDFDPCIIINVRKRYIPRLWYDEGIRAAHVRLALVGLREQERQGDICQVVFRLPDGSPIKSCGVHCLLGNQDELLHLSQRPTSSLGKRPRPRGSSDIVDDEYDQQQQWLSSSLEPADDHPKRRQIDLNF